MGLEIEKKLSQAGYQILGDNKSIERLIIEILQTKNVRYLKTIPYLIYKHSINSMNIYNQTKNRQLLKIILGYTTKIFVEQDIPIAIPNSIIARDQELESNKMKMSFSEFRDEFELQMKKEGKSNFFIDKKKIYEERDIQYSLSQLFTKKENQIIKRLLENRPVSRTDYEYYSRKTKKKIRSIINLEDFARTLNDKTPKYDDKLYYLKKLLEQLLDTKENQSIVEEFRISDNLLVLGLRENDGETQVFSKRLSSIKDKEILDLLNQYKQHDFR